MKISPREQKLEEVLRSSKLVAGGFMGNDRRRLSEIIDADLAAIFRSKLTVKQIAERMQEITQKATEGLGNWVAIDRSRQAMVDEAKGWLACPWPHSGRFAKRVTILKLMKSGATMKWSDLNIHMIAAHGFFEGKGSNFRIEPKLLIEMIF
jgi:hypothetical protein